MEESDITQDGFDGGVGLAAKGEAIGGANGRDKESAPLRYYFEWIEGVQEYTLKPFPAGEKEGRK